MGAYTKAVSFPERNIDNFIENVQNLFFYLFHYLKLVYNNIPSFLNIKN